MGHVLRKSFLLHCVYLLVFASGLFSGSCKTVSNRINERVLDCGPEVDGQAYSKILDPAGNRMTRDEIEVIDLESSKELKGVVSSKGCISSSIKNNVLIRSRKSEWASVTQEGISPNKQVVSLNNFAGENLRIICDEKSSISVGQNFQVSSLLSENVSETFKNTYKLDYELSQVGSSSPSRGSLTLAEAVDKGLLFSTSVESGEYLLKIRIKNLLRNSAETVKVCPLKFDRNPPDVGLAHSLKEAVKTITVKGRDSIALVVNRDMISFESSDLDLSHVEYCLEEMNDNFSDLNSDAGRAWNEGSRLKSCSVQSSSKIDVNRTLNVAKRTGFWTLRFRGVDRLSNVSVWKMQTILFHQDETVELIRNIATSRVSAAVLEKNSLAASKAALESLRLYRALPTAYEKNLVSSHVLAALLRTYEQTSIGVNLLGLDLGVKTIAMSRDGKSLFVGSYSANLYLFDLETGKLKSILKGVTTSGASPVFSSDGKSVYFPDYVGGVSAWDLETNTTKIVVNSNELRGVDSIVLSEDGQSLLIACSDNSFEFYGIDGKNVKARIPTFDSAIEDNDRYALLLSALSLDGKLMVSNSRKSFDINIWSLETSKLNKQLKGHSAKIQSLHLSKDASELYSVSDDKSIKVWDLETGAEKRTINLENVDPSSVQFMADDLRAFGWTGSGYRSFYLDGSKSESVLIPASGLFRLTPDGKRLVVGSGQNNFYGYLYMFLLPKGFLEKTLPLSGPIMVAPERKGYYAFDAKGDVVSIEELKADVVRWRYASDENPSFVAFSPDGELLMTIQSEQNLLQLRSMRTGKTLRSARIDDFGSLAAISPDNKRLALATGKDIVIYDGDSLKELFRFPEPSPSVLTLTFSVDGKILFGAYVDGTVQSWDVYNGKPREVFSGMNSQLRSLAVSPDGRDLVGSGVQDNILKWSLIDRKYVELIDHHDEVTAVQYTGDGKILLSGGRDKTLRLWDAESNEVLARIPMENLIQSIVAGPSSGFVTYESNVRAARFWSLDIDELSNKLCAQVKNYIDPALCKNIPSP